MLNSKTAIPKCDKAIELLIRADIINIQIFNEVKTLSQKAKIPFNRALVATGQVTYLTVQNSYSACNLINSGQISITQALKILIFANKLKIDFDSAQNQYDTNQFAVLNSQSEQNQDHESYSDNNHDNFEIFLNLILDLNLITIDKLQETFNISQDSNQGFLRILIGSNYLTPELGDVLLENLTLIKEQKITVEQAKNNICSIKSLSLNDFESQNNPIRFGQILKMADLISHAEFQDCVFESLMTNNKTGEILVSKNLLDDNMLELVLKSQNHVNRGFLTVVEAITVLKNSHNEVAKIKRSDIVA